MIYTQTEKGVKNIRYGLFPSSYNGCSWIAICNALELMGEKPNRTNIKRQAESFLPMGGLFGMPFYCFESALSSFRIDFDISEADFERMKKDRISILWYRKKDLRAHYLLCEYLPKENVFRYFNPTFRAQPPNDLIEFLGAVDFRIIHIKRRMK
ncbi:MAG: hypothetical protein J6B51_05860 [Clostridia bacterium]|nr:hypothetical protein [Clostridia bacterium]MBO5299588.1 hypothetical protein [Clostridia bacterium]